MRLWILCAFFVSAAAYADDCSIELVKKSANAASKFTVKGTELSDGVRSAKLEPSRAEALCADLNQIVWEARRQQKKKCRPFARIQVKSTREDFELCHAPKSISFEALFWVRSKALPLLEKK
jgi:hypothetical protein